MARLRLTQLAAREDGRYPVTITWTDDDGTEETVEGLSAAGLTAEDRADLRWYFEEALEQCAYDPPARKKTQRVEDRMDNLGKTLFRAFFEAPGDASDLWARICDRIKDARIEISTSVAETASIPWELLRDPRTDRPLLQTAPAFVRVPKRGAVRPNAVRLKEDEPLRVLLAICRPGGTADVSFRSVARQLAKGLGDSKTVDLTVLRPPTFEHLAEVLAEARVAGKPFHLLHFDGHGSYAPAGMAGPAAAGMERFRADGPRGMLYFEDPAADGHRRAVDGRTLGALLNDNGVAALVLNACQSADAGDERGDEKGGGEAKATPAGDPVEQVRAQGSLAQETVDAGVGAVLAMRYSVYVVTAAAFVGRFYELVAAGRGFGEAASEARKALLAAPMRDFGGDRVAFQDWSVPVVFEANPTPLLPQRREAETTFTLDAAAKGDDLPAAPEIGFIGRDAELLRLDRAFDTQNIVLLHAYAGSGKTATAVEFARWYVGTGGAAVALFDSFERHLPLARLLDRVEKTFGEMLEQSGIHWLALDTAQRAEVAVQIFRQLPVLWVWDNVETVAGFPAGAPSAWTAAEQAELKAFLARLVGTKAKVLLTSRREEQEWLGDLPAPIDVRPMPMGERRALAAALADKYGHGAATVGVLEPLLKWSAGNPMALTVALRQALRDKRITPGQIEAYVAKLRAGEADFTDDESEGRSKSLGASLAYGYETFSPDERALLSLLQFFQGLVDADALVAMGHKNNPGAAPPYAGVARETWIALLTRAAEIGLITHEGGEYFTVHPALPWFLQREFAAAFPDPNPLRRAWVTAMADLGNYWATRAIQGERGALLYLQALEGNLLAARAVAVREGWWEEATALMQGLRQVFEPAGRWGAWADLVADVVPLVEDATGDPLPGREEVWSLTVEYRVALADHAQDIAAAIALLQRRVAVDRRCATAARTADPQALTADELNAVRMLAASLQQLGTQQMLAGDAACRSALAEAQTVCRRAGLRREEAVAAFNLGQAYMGVPTLRDLDRAAAATRESLDLRDPDDAVGCVKCHNQLGAIARERFDDLRARLSNGAPSRVARLWAALRRRPIPDEKALLVLWQTAEGEYQKALELAPDDAFDNLAVTHNQLGVLYKTVGETDPAIEHYKKSLFYEDKRGNPYGVAQTCFNLANLYRQTGRFDDAMDYAQAALNGFSAFGTNAADMIAKTQSLIAAIEQKDKS